MKFRFISFFLVLTSFINFAEAKETFIDPALKQSTSDWLKEAIIIQLSEKDITQNCKLDQLPYKLSKLKQYGINVVYLPQLFQIDIHKTKNSENETDFKCKFSQVESNRQKINLKEFLSVISKAGFKIVIEFPQIKYQESPEITNYFKDTRDEENEKTQVGNEIALNLSHKLLRQNLIKEIKSITKIYPITGFGFLQGSIAKALGFSDFLTEEIDRLNLVTLMKLGENSIDFKATGYLAATLSNRLNHCIFGHENLKVFVERYKNEASITDLNGVLLRTNEVTTTASKDHPDYLKQMKLKTVIDYTLGSLSGSPTIPIIMKGNTLGEWVKESLCLSTSDVWLNENTKSLMELYLKLGFLRHSYQVFYNGNIRRVKTAGDEEQIFAFQRENDSEKALVVANLSNTPFTGYIEIEAEKVLHNYLEPEKYMATKDGNIKLTLGAYEYLIFLYN